MQIFAVHFAAVDDVRTARIGRDAAAFAAGGDRPPIAFFDAAMIAARHDHRCSAVLLCAVQPVRKSVIGRDVIELTRRLVEPRTPRARAIERYAGTLVAAEHHRGRVRRVDPHLMKVVAVRGSLDRRELRATVGRPVHRRIGDVHDVGVLRIDGHMAKIPPALPQAHVTVGEAPRSTGVIAAVQSAVFRIDDRVDARWLRRCDREPDLADVLRR